MELPRNWLLKNPQFLTIKLKSLCLAILPTPKLFILVKFHNDWVKIVDFLLIEYFLASSVLLFDLCFFKFRAILISILSPRRRLNWEITRRWKYASDKQVQFTFQKKKLLLKFDFSLEGIYKIFVPTDAALYEKQGNLPEIDS